MRGRNQIKIGQNVLEHCFTFVDDPHSQRILSGKGTRVRFGLPVREMENIAEIFSRNVEAECETISALTA